MDAVNDKEELDKLALQFRYVITDMICRAGSGHIGGALSLVEIITTLYFRIMRLDPANPKWEERDRLVLSKGHAAPILYAALAYRGFFPKSWLATLNADGTKLPSHADARSVPGIDMTTGSLGQGLSAACGIALAGRFNKKGYRTYCIMGDGECDEGQNWEAAMFAAHWKLDALTAILDYNKLQIDGFTREVMNLEPLAEKWRSFGWEVFEMDGHDWDEVYGTIRKAAQVKGKPAVIIAHTIKSKGHSLTENKPESHNIKVPDEAAHKKNLESVAPAALPY
jgi:transketolase